MRRTSGTDLRAVDGRIVRKKPRVRHTALAWVEGEQEQATRGLARLVDLSPEGAGLIMARRFDAGTPVVVELLLPGSLRLRAHGNVVHSSTADGDQFRTGVRFGHPPVLVDGDHTTE